MSTSASSRTLRWSAPSPISSGALLDRSGASTRHARSAVQGNGPLAALRHGWTPVGLCRGVVRGVGTRERGGADSYEAECAALHGSSLAGKQLPR